VRESDRIEALQAVYQDEERERGGDAATRKRKRYQLMLCSNDCGLVDLPAKDVAEIKALVARS
jgi:hypothetical protein